MSTIKDSVILLSGGTGSLGQALTKELLGWNPKAIRIYSRGEYAQYEMKRHYPQENIRYIIGDIRDTERLNQIMVGVDYVIHTAALKHVPICEYNPDEAIKTNVLGSMNVINVARAHKVKKVLAISSDKAVHPISIYGASKLAMERQTILVNQYTQTKCSCVRFGNFEGSKGSVLPLWKEQAKLGYIEVTDKDMLRFWITLEEAAKFCVRMLQIMKGGEIFVPKMFSKRLYEMIDTLDDVKIREIGKRPGEKLTELLFAEGENPINKGDYYQI